MLSKDYHPLAAKGQNSRENRMTREEELIRDGWEKQSTYDEPRLSDIVQAYKEIGFEVHLEPFTPDDEPGCTECMKISPEKYKTIYTRKQYESKE